MAHAPRGLLANTFGPIWMMGILVIVVIRNCHPKRRATHERAARSILPEGQGDA